VSLVRSGAIRRYPHIIFVLPHGGGFIPFAAHRLAMTMTFDSDRTVEELLADLRTFHVDTAQAVALHGELRADCTRRDGPGRHRRRQRSPVVTPICGRPGARLTYGEDTPGTNTEGAS